MLSTIPARIIQIDETSILFLFFSIKSKTNDAVTIVAVFDMTTFMTHIQQLSILPMRESFVTRWSQQHWNTVG